MHHIHAISDSSLACNWYILDFLASSLYESRIYTCSSAQLFFTMRDIFSTV